MHASRPSATSHSSGSVYHSEPTINTERPERAVEMLSSSPTSSASHYTRTSTSQQALPQAGSRSLSSPTPDFYSISPNKSGSPPLHARSSSDSVTKISGLSSSARRRESLREEADNTIVGESGSLLEEDEVVPTSFDEGTLRALCEMDCGVPLLLDRIKQSMVSCREASIFLKKRAVLETEYGHSLQKLSQSTMAAYTANDGKAGTFVKAWETSMRIHEIMGDNRIKFANNLNEMSDELASLAKEVDKNRKQAKDLAMRYERALLDSEMATEKAKHRFDSTGEELERLLVTKEGESVKETGVQSSKGGVSGKRAIGKAVAKGGMLLKGKNPVSIQRQEEDIRARMSAASDAFRKAVLETQAMRQEYFNFQLPRILRSLKECADEIDTGLQFHLRRYAFLFERTILSDGTTLVPAGIEDGPGIKMTMESIDNRADFKVYMQNYAVAHGTSKGPRREGPWQEGFLPPIAPHVDKTLPSHSSHSHLAMGGSPTPDRRYAATFGVDLGEQMMRDNVEIPKIVEKCCQAVERYGLQSQGIYRLSGTVSKVTRLKEHLDRDIDAVDLDSEEWIGDINNVTSVLKLWLRELPEPLLTFHLHSAFIDAAKIDIERLRHIRLHEQVNALPDPNYATLKYLMGHLHKVTSYEAQNQMSISNLAIVFGPTLFGHNHAPPPGAGGMPNGGGASSLIDMNFQCKAVEVILEHYADIFIDENEGM